MVGVRDATPSDADGIRNVHLNAFETSLEADLVEQLGRDGDVVISMVAVEDDGAIVGHILFSRTRVEANGRRFEALGLAPVAVLPDRQNAGIGSRLIEAGLVEAAGLGTEIVFLVGEPGYYGRFGFAVETAAPFASPYAGAYFRAKLLTAGVILPSSGRADYAPAFTGLE